MLCLWAGRRSKASRRAASAACHWALRIQFLKCGMPLRGDMFICIYIYVCVYIFIYIYVSSVAFLLSSLFKENRLGIFPKVLSIWPWTQDLHPFRISLQDTVLVYFYVFLPSVAYFRVTTFPVIVSQVFFFVTEFQGAPCSLDSVSLPVHVVCSCSKVCHF